MGMIVLGMNRHVITVKPIFDTVQTNVEAGSHRS